MTDFKPDKTNKPDDESMLARLLALVDDRLDADEAAEVHAMVKDNPQAQALLEDVRRVAEALRHDDGVECPPSLLRRAQMIFGEPAGRPGVAETLAAWSRDWWRDVQTVVASLTDDSRAQPALAGLRGAAMAYQLSYRAGDITVALEVEPADDAGPNDDLRDVTGQITGNDKPIESIVLVRDDQRISEIAVDEHGMFHLQCQPGRHQLGIRMNEETETSDPGAVILPDLDIE